jgi:hypothetical protein
MAISPADSTPPFDGDSASAARGSHVLDTPLGAAASSGCTFEEGSRLKSISGLVAVITGSSSGIGRETAGQFGQHGASVVLTAHNEVALREKAKDVERIGAARMWW